MNRPLLFSILFAIAVQAFVAVYFAPYAWEAVLTMDGDVALRLSRVMELHQGGAWYDSIAERLDAPYGELVNWSRPLDVLLYAGAAVGSLFTDFRSALILWAAVISPILLLAFLPLLQRMLQPVLGASAVLPAAILLLLQTKFTVAFIVGRADHHSLMALLFMALLLALVRAAMGDTGRRSAMLAGASMGLACWVSIESMVAAAFGGAVWLMLWVWENERRRLKQALLYALVAVAVLAVAVAAEHPPQDWLRELHAKVSVVHLTLAALAAAAVGGLLLLDRVRPTDCAVCRATRAALAMNAAAIAAVLIFPDLLRGPLAADGAGTSMWHTEMVGEFQPRWPVNPTRAAIFALHLGLPLIAIVGAVVLMRRRPEPERKVLALSLMGLLLYVPLTMAQVRWANYPQVLMILPLMMAIREIMNSRAPWRILAAAALLLAPATAMLGFAIMAPPQEKPSAGEACDKAAMLRYLGAQEPSSDQDILLTYVSDGPEVIWNSRYRVVAANYLFNTGFGAAVEAFRAPSDELARKLAGERGVALVLVCADNPEALLHRAKSGRSFHDRLVEGDAPAWLEPVPLPDHLRPHRLYRTVGPGRS